MSGRTPPPTALPSRSKSPSADEVIGTVRMVDAMVGQMKAELSRSASKSDLTLSAATVALEKVSATSRSIDQLDALSRDIHRLTGVIQAIASQTRMLALNATIEASRAGAAGAGFAVVAREIKELAQHTAQATDNIERRLVDIRTATEAATATMSDTEGSVGTIRVHVEELAAVVAAQCEVTDRVREHASRASGAVSELTRVEPDADLVPWTDALRVGVGVIDDDHRVLIEMLNELARAMRAGSAAEVARRTLDGLVEYTQSHFGREETLMARHRYPGREAHVKAHVGFRAKVSEVVAELEAGNAHALSFELLGFLQQWLVDHIQRADRALGTFLAERGVQSV